MECKWWCCHRETAGDEGEGARLGRATEDWKPSVRTSVCSCHGGERSGAAVGMELTQNRALHLSFYPLTIAVSFNRIKVLAFQTGH